MGKERWRRRRALGLATGAGVVEGVRGGSGGGGRGDWLERLTNIEDTGSQHGEGGRLGNTAVKTT